MSEEWTPTRISILIALWNEGLTTSAMGVRLGVTKNAVVGKIHRLGLPKRGSPIRQKPKPAQIISLEALRAGMWVNRKFLWGGIPPTERSFSGGGF